ncbi:site-specific DNA-methyltransferase [Helicobacter turcicus]|uniref:site-specific DNA-methyltransferase (adenine-specific) n=1 Tax=Helicobacter turcicus TaxID=2867412 RepID=A0ABS7JKX7_9HELI|nr:site-specific DNA-methyltransferase [Helicobacter turcicus]
MQDSQNTSNAQTSSLAQLKANLIEELKQRVEDKIIEENNAELLEKLIKNAETKAEALSISALGTTYKRTGFHFDKRLEKQSEAIHYLAKDETLSFRDSNSVLTHSLIIGDNYPALLNLLITYRQKVKVIYIDPPYGKDDLGEFAQTNYNNAISRDNLLSMLYPRLVLAKELLKDDGVIFCSIDDRNQAYVKCLFDEVFGERNFVSSLVWQKKKGGSQDSQDFAREHEYILCHKKFLWQINDITQEQNEKDFNKIVNGKKAKILKLEKWGIGSLKEDAPSLYYSIKDTNGNDFYPAAPNGVEGRWRKKPENLDKEHIFWQKDSKGRLTPYEVIYFDEVQNKEKVIKTRTIFTEYGTTTDATKEIQAIFENKVFDTPKPINLIKHLLKISTSANNTNLDNAQLYGGGGGRMSS